jgi:holo-[acyl-carrier protein] synthase
MAFARLSARLVGCGADLRRMDMPELGVDIVEIARVKAALERHTNGFRRRVYTDLEWEQCGRSYPSLAGRFAAKEAVMKSLGTGGMAFRDIEIVRSRSGKPEVRLYGRMAERARRIGVTRVGVTISHSRDNAVAVALAETGPSTTPEKSS